MGKQSSSKQERQLSGHTATLAVAGSAASFGWLSGSLQCAAAHTAGTTTHRAGQHKHPLPYARAATIFHRLPLFFLLGCAALLCGGCAFTLSPPEHRARQYSAEFGCYDAPTQERLRDATVAIGDDRTAVYIAFGKPQRRRIGYGRNTETSATIRLEYWDYSGYPSGKREGHFIMLNNGGFASPLSTRPYGSVTIEFADAQVRSYSHDANQNVPDRGSWQMFVPRDPHQ